MSGSGEPPSKPSFSLTEGILLIVGFIVVSLVFAAFVTLVNNFNNTIALPMLAIAGIILMLIFLTGIAYVFTRTGLQDKTQALGLPPGSIQAVIALSLIVLFAILSIFIFTSLGDPPSHQIAGLGEADRDKEIAQLGSQFAGWQIDTKTADPKTTTYTVFVHSPVPDQRSDIGKQLVVLIGTLMTSAVSFYFGSRAVATAADSLRAAGTADDSGSLPIPPPVPTIVRIEPVAGISAGVPATVTIVGENLSTADAVEIVLSGSPLEVTGVAPAGNGLTCTVIPAAAAVRGSYDVTVKAGSTVLVVAQASLKVI